MLHNIIETRKVSSKKVVQQDTSSIRNRINKSQLRGMILNIALITKYHLLSFIAGEIRANGIECTPSIGLGNVRIAERFDFVVVDKIDGCDIDGIGNVVSPIAGRIELTRGCVVCSLTIQLLVNASLDTCLDAFTASWNAFQGMVVTNFSVGCFPNTSFAKVWSYATKVISSADDVVAIELIC